MYDIDHDQFIVSIFFVIVIVLILLSHVQRCRLKTKLWPLFCSSCPRAACVTSREKSARAQHSYDFSSDIVWRHMGRSQQLLQFWSNCVNYYIERIAGSSTTRLYSVAVSTSDSDEASHLPVTPVRFRVRPRDTNPTFCYLSAWNQQTYTSGRATML